MTRRRDASGTRRRSGAIADRGLPREFRKRTGPVTQRVAVKPPVLFGSRSEGGAFLDRFGQDQAVQGFGIDDRRISQDDPGKIAKAARDVANRALKRCESEGWISLGYRAVTILRPDWLAECVEGGG